jgi:hypothetical protein
MSGIEIDFRATKTVGPSAGIPSPEELESQVPDLQAKRLFQRFSSSPSLKPAASSCKV